MSWISIECGRPMSTFSFWIGEDQVYSVQIPQFPHMWIRSCSSHAFIFQFDKGSFKKKIFGRLTIQLRNVESNTTNWVNKHITFFFLFLCNEPKSNQFARRPHFLCDGAHTKTGIDLFDWMCVVKNKRTLTFRPLRKMCDMTVTD